MEKKKRYNICDFSCKAWSRLAKKKIHICDFARKVRSGCVSFFIFSYFWLASNAARHAFAS